MSLICDVEFECEDCGCIEDDTNGMGACKQCGSHNIKDKCSCCGFSLDECTCTEEEDTYGGYDGNPINKLD